MSKAIIVTIAAIALVLGCQAEEEEKSEQSKPRKISSIDEQPASDDSGQDEEANEFSSSKDKKSTKSGDGEIESALFAFGLQSLVDDKDQQSATESNGKLSGLLGGFIDQFGGLDKVLGMMTGLKDKLLALYDEDDNKKISLSEYNTLKKSVSGGLADKFDGATIVEKCKDAKQAELIKLCDSAIKKYDENDDGELSDEELAGIKEKLSSFGEKQDVFIDLLAQQACTLNVGLCEDDLALELKKNGGLADLLASLTDILSKFGKPNADASK